MINLPLGASLAYFGNVPCANWLITHGADINAQLKGPFLSTPLHIAIENNHQEIVRILLLSGANHALTDGLFHTPLLKSIIIGYEPVVEVFIENNIWLTVEDWRVINTLLKPAEKIKALKFIQQIEENCARKIARIPVATIPQGDKEEVDVIRQSLMQLVASESEQTTTKGKQAITDDLATAASCSLQRRHLDDSVRDLDRALADIEAMGLSSTTSQPIPAPSVTGAATSSAAAAQHNDTDLQQAADADTMLALARSRADLINAQQQQSQDAKAASSSDEVAMAPSAP